jgi:shikimate 5-dehydrogenase
MPRRVLIDHFDIIVNATPVRNRSFFSKKELHNKIILDCNYGKPTKFLQAAKQAGAVTIDGLPLLLGQAQAQFRLWTGQPLPAGLKKARG